jgi:hypothetical protein
MSILVAAFLAAFTATVSYNAETCLIEGAQNVQEAHYCKQLSSNDMQAENFEWIRTGSWGVIN